MSSGHKLLVIASAGGHLTQAMCATSLCDNIVLVSNQENVASPRICKIYKIWDTQYNPFIHFFNLFFAIFVLLKERPQAVLSTGGPIALSFALICKFLPLKFVYVDTLSRVVELSHTGKLIKKCKLYNEFFCQWRNVAEHNNVAFIGKCFDILSENKYQLTTKNSPQVPVILVTVGTNDYPFTRLFEMLYQLPLYHDKGVYWVIQTGVNKLTQFPANGKVVEMISRNEIEQLVKQASVVISHCGIGSINLMLSYQKRVLFVPRLAKYQEFSDDHQLQIANEISSEIFTVVQPEQPIPLGTLSQLRATQIVTEPVDTTNYAVAKAIKAALFPV